MVGTLVSDSIEKKAIASMQPSAVLDSIESVNEVSDLLMHIDHLCI